MKTPTLLRQLCTLALFLAAERATSQQTPATLGTGLRGQYYVGTNLKQLALTRTDPTIDFNWTIGPDGNHFVEPGPGVPGEYFSVRWTGHLYAPVTGVYTFQMATDDGMRVWIGGRKVLDSWQDQRVSSYTTHVVLTAGRYYSVRAEYYQQRWDSRALLQWQLPDTFTELAPIPTAFLYSSLPATARPLVAVKPAKPQAPSVTAPTTGSSATASAPKVAPKPASAVVRAARPAPKPVKPVPTPRPPVAASDTLAAVLPDAAAFSKGAAVTLPNLYFTQSTASLLSTSRPTLNALARILRQQPTMQLEIAGHTDNVGDAVLNLRLSEQRARMVRQYLVQQGIDSVRLTARGYGGTRPVADNRDVQQRARNRRVEAVVQ